MSDCIQKEFDSDDSNIYEVEFVYGKKMFKKKPLYAVKWLGWTKSQMSWEPISNFTAISSYLVRRIETRLCYAQYYKKIAPSSGGIRVHVKGKFCQIQQTDAILQKKSIEGEKQIVINSSETQDIYHRAQKILTQMKQNILCSNNNKQHLKSQKKVKKQTNHLQQILKSQERNETISQQEKMISKQNNKKCKFNNKKIFDVELEKDIQFLIKYEKQQQKLKQQQQQQQQQVEEQLKLIKKNNNQQVFSECQIILNEPDNLEQVIPFSKQNLPPKNTEKQIKSQRNISNQQVIQELTDFELRKSESKVKNIQSPNVQDTHSYPQEESFEIDLLLVEDFIQSKDNKDSEDCEYQLKQREKLKDIEKSPDISLQKVKLLPYQDQNNQLKKVRVVKSVLNSKTIQNVPELNSEIYYKTEKQFINEVIQEQKKKQSQLHQYGLTLDYLLQLDTKPQQKNIKTSQQIQQEIQQLQLEKIKLNKTNRCSIPIIQKLKDFEVQQYENNLLNIEMIQYDLDLNEIRFHKIMIEIIESHHLLIGKLLFKCLYDNGMKYYVEYDKLKIHCPTLLLDYMIVNSILI